jgi:hypothetical protein
MRCIWFLRKIRCDKHPARNGKKIGFRLSGWIQRRRPKDIAPLSYAKTKKKKHSIVATLHDNNWIHNLNYWTWFTTAHLLEFVNH